MNQHLHPAFCRFYLTEARFHLNSTALGHYLVNNGSAPNEGDLCSEQDKPVNPIRHYEKLRQTRTPDEETPERGLGPIFNNVSCVACHSAPAVGGSSAILETRFGRLLYGRFDPLTELGGSLLQQSALDPAIEAIPDSAILLNAAIPRPDGITGRPSMVQDVVSGQPRVGRFGWKAQQATLLAFSGDAYLNEMGITSRLFPQENAPNGNTDLLALFDNVADPEDVEDPETGKANIDNFTDFMRFLAPPPQLPLTLSAQSGQILFNGIGCAACHTPVMHTGANSVAALDRKPVRLYSDLLLHNMGLLGDGIAQGSAHPREMRTAPLWGLRASAPYLHDGRAATVNAAIRAHDGEARYPRDRYLLLLPIQRRQLLDFLNSI
ncbi:MAG: hypothetical protein DME22_26115 [Verrucomicrobia bacterium]|nr:MAG: hypothetical protein DME22_26115 [Verrucomicrobiota bacterium]